MKRIATGLIVVILLIACTAAYATLAWYKAFNDLYKPKPGTALHKAKCSICHVNPTGKGALNPYGKMLGKKVSAAALKAIEKKDADKDRAPNIAEIKAGTLPGNP